MLVSDFAYDLPEELIAQEPLPGRAGSRLLYLKTAGELEDLSFLELPNVLRANDLLVFNNTKVLPARLLGRRSGSKALAVSPHNPASREFLQGRVDVLLVRQVSQQPNEWECLVKPGRKIGVGERLFFGDKHDLQAEVVARGQFGERRIRFDPVADFYAVLDRIGHVPLPPYISREDRLADRERYQTVYARERGSVAAPTAGLHFTPQVLDNLKQRGIETAEITLHVGLGTFQPIHVEKVEDHRLHAERYCISEDAAEKISRAVSAGRRVVAVGTTTVRTLEYAAKVSSTGGIQAGSGEAELFIYPGYEFRVVSAMLTNFHLPQSTLLMLVCAFGGQERVLRAYEHSVREKYRFYSYGDCMLLEKPASR